MTPVAATLDLADLRCRLEEIRPDVAFNRVESLGGSDRTAAAVPMLLDALGLPYTGCPTEALLATANKPAVQTAVASGRAADARLDHAPLSLWETGRG